MLSDLRTPQRSAKKIPFKNARVLDLSTPLLLEEQRPIYTKSRGLGSGGPFL
jgi:hypothetical protein